jgi:hypothetical protein
MNNPAFRSAMTIIAWGLCGTASTSDGPTQGALVQSGVLIHVLCDTPQYQSCLDTTREACVTDLVALQRQCLAEFKGDPETAGRAFVTHHMQCLTEARAKKNAKTFDQVKQCMDGKK